MKMTSHFTLLSCAAMMMTILMMIIMSINTNVNAQNDPSVAMEGVVQLTSSNFDQYVGTPNTAALVEFYAPWCGHCKNMAEDYALLGKALFNSSSDAGKLIIGKVDATVEKELAAEQKVRGFPTIYFYPAGSNVSEEYSGGRSAEDFVKFLKTKISNLNVVVQRAPESAKDISASALMKMINDGKKDVMVMFYAPWCGFCKQFKPMYEQLAKIYENDQDDLQIVRVNADDVGNRQKLSAFTIHGFPTLMFVPRGDINATKVFHGDRGMEELVHFINENAHKFRLLDGDLSWKYGADRDLAKSVASLATMTSTENKDESKIQKALDQLKALANEKKAKDKNIAIQHYLSAAKQIVSEGVTAIDKQMQELRVKLNSTKYGKARDAIATQLNVVGSIMTSVMKK